MLKHMKKKSRPSPAWPRRMIAHAMDITQYVILSALQVFTLFRLGNMQLDGLLAFAGATAALLFGFTSLQFNRARAYPTGPTQRRSLVVAELALRSTLAFVMGAAIAAVLFSLLIDAYSPRPWTGYPRLGLPLLCAFIPTVFMIYALLTFVKATRILVHGMFLRIDPRSLSRRQK